MQDPFSNQKYLQGHRQELGSTIMSGHILYQKCTVKSLQKKDIIIATVTLSQLFAIDYVENISRNKIIPQK